LDPNKFDNAIASCADFVKTADPADYSIITSMESFCVIAGPLTLSATPAASIAEPLASDTAPTVTVANPVHPTISGAATTHTGGAQQMSEPGVVNLGTLQCLHSSLSRGTVHSTSIPSPRPHMWLMLRESPPIDSRDLKSKKTRGGR
jgi:hypothetical protein